MHFTPIYVHFPSPYVTLLLSLRAHYHDLGADFAFTFTKPPIYMHFPNLYVTLTPPLRADSILHPPFTGTSQIFIRRQKRAEAYNYLGSHYHYSPLKAGLRFCTNACMPSWWSVVLRIAV